MNYKYSLKSCQKIAEENGGQCLSDRFFHVKDKIKSIYYFNNISSFYPADAKTWNYLDNLSKENEQLHSLISKWKK